MRDQFNRLLLRRTFPLHEEFFVTGPPARATRSIDPARQDALLADIRRQPRRRLSTVAA